MPASDRLLPMDFINLAILDILEYSPTLSRVEVLIPIPIHRYIDISRRDLGDILFPVQLLRPREVKKRAGWLAVDTCHRDALCRFR
jgi:hypothetical protein